MRAACFHILFCCFYKVYTFCISVHVSINFFHSRGIGYQRRLHDRTFYITYNSLFVDAKINK